jgi:hypothetical protein
MAVDMDLIWVGREGKYFFKSGWTEGANQPCINMMRWRVSSQPTSPL